MTSYVNPSTRSGGVEHVVVPERQTTVPVDDAPFDDEQYVRVNGEWVPVTTPPIIPDTLAPDPPTALVATGTMAADGASVDYGLSWNAPTTNTDATALTDLAYYVVRWRYGTTGSWTTFVSNDTSIIVRGLKPATDFQWNVLARDYSGNDSAWAADTVTGLADATGPQQPSTPTLASRLGTLQITWDGLDHAGSAMPADFSHLAIYTSATTGGPWAYAGRLSGASTYFVSGIPIGATRFVTSIAFDTSGNASPRSNEASIVVQGITAPDLEANSVTANAIAVGAVAASKISTGELAAGVRIIAGPETGTHAELTATGFKAFIEDPVDLVPNESVRIGTDTNDLFALSDAAGNIKASISDEGKASFAGASVDSDPTVMGIPLVGSQGASLYDIVSFWDDATYGRDPETDPIGIIESYAKGVVAWEQFDCSLFSGNITVGQERALFEIGYDMEPGRQYTFRMSPMLVTVNAGATALLRLRATFDGSIPNLTSQVIAYDYNQSSTAVNISCCIPQRLVNGGSTGQTQVRFLLCLSAQGGNVAAYATQSVEVSIDDLGPTKVPTGTVRNFLNTGTPSAVPVKKTYTKTYASTAAYTYQGDGDRRTDTSDVVQGYNSYNGDGRGLWLFPTSIATDLTGATVNKVEVYAYANSWYYNSGGTALIKVHGYTTLASIPGGGPAMTTAKTQTGWPKPGGKWVTLPSSLYAGFKSGAYRGFGMGPSGGTNLTYYGRFSGGTSARIRVTYTK